VQTVDRAKIAARLSAARPADVPPLDVCIQVNASGETSKSGVAPEQAVALAQAVVALPRLRLRGIMAFPSHLRHRLRRAQFGVLRDAFDACRAAGLPLDTLSMGCRRISRTQSPKARRWCGWNLDLRAR